MSSNSITSTAREHVFPLFVKYVSANVLGMIGYSCYILADTFFVARGIGSDAIAALNLVLPAFSLLNGTGLMIGMGAAARYSLSSGRADSEIHRTIFTQALQLAFVAMLFFFSIGLFFARPLCVLLGADGTTLPHAIPYISILLMFSPLFLCNNLLNCFVRNDGEPRLSMTAMLVGSLTNIVLDIAFVIGLHMGVAGAALATILSQALAKTVWLKSGGNLVIEPTEALTVIDVNTAKSVSKKTSEETYLKTNLEAAEAIAVQLRLRNLSGIIIVDFIDMKEEESRKALLAAMRRAVAADPVKTVLVDMTPLGLVELTRKKIRRPLHEQVRV